MVKSIKNILYLFYYNHSFDFLYISNIIYVYLIYLIIIQAKINIGFIKKQN